MIPPTPNSHHTKKEKKEENEKKIQLYNLQIQFARFNNDMAMFVKSLHMFIALSSISATPVPNHSVHWRKAFK